MKIAETGTVADLAALQAIVDEVNAEMTAVAVIDGYATANDATAMTVVELEATGVVGVLAANLDEYKIAVAAADGFVDVAAVQSMIDNVNASVAESDALLAIQGYADANDAAALTVDQLNDVGADVIAPNLDAYKVAVADSTAATLPDAASVQKLVTDVNAEQVNVIIAAIDGFAKGNDASSLEMYHFEIVGVTGTVLDIAEYRSAVEAADAVPDVATLQSIVDDANDDAAVKDILSQLQAMATANDASALTLKMLEDAGAEPINYMYLQYYKTAIADAVATDIETVEELNTLIAAANTAGDDAEKAAALAAINQMAVSSDASALEKSQLEVAGATGMVWDISHFEAYQSGIEAATSVADVAALQAIIDAENVQLAIDKIVGFAVNDDASTMVPGDLVDAGVDPGVVIPTNIGPYRTAVAAAEGTDVDASAKIETLVVDVNSQVVTAAVDSIKQMAVDNDASTLSPELLTEAGITFEADYLESYKTAIASAISLADAAAIQALVDKTNLCEDIRRMPASNDAMDLTIDMLTELGIDNTFSVNLEAYQLAVFDADTITGCGDALQDLIDEANFTAIQDMASAGDAFDLTEEMLIAVGVTGTVQENMDDYIAAIEDAGSIADLAALQAIIDTVNEENEIAAIFEQIQGMAQNSDASALTTDMLTTVGITDVRADRLNDYKTAIAAETSIADIPALQAIIDAVNAVSVETFTRNGVSMYPNPSNGMVTITLPSYGRATLRVMDLTGRTILDQVLVNKVNTIDLSENQSGVYIIEIGLGSKFVTSRLILN